jgi:hypothetical protein
MCHTREEEEEEQMAFWMLIKGICPELFIYFTMYLADLYYTLRA